MIPRGEYIYVAILAQVVVNFSEMNTMHRDPSGFTSDEDERPVVVDKTLGDANDDDTVGSGSSGDDAGDTSPVLLDTDPNRTQQWHSLTRKA